MIGPVCCVVAAVDVLAQLHGPAGGELQRARATAWSRIHQDMRDLHAIADASGDFHGEAVVGQPAA